MKSFLLAVLGMLLFSGTCLGQLSVESLGYIYPLDSIEIERFRENSNEFQTFHKYGGYRKTQKIFPYGSFLGIKINYIPPPHNFSGLYVTNEGDITPTTKELVDSLFMKAFKDSSFSVYGEEIFFFYMLFTRSGYLVNESSDLLSFEQSIKDKFDSYRKEQMTISYDSSDMQTIRKYSYNRAFRTVYQYTFFTDQYGNWVRLPEKSIVFEKVGPFNYYR